MCISKNGITFAQKPEIMRTKTVILLGLLAFLYACNSSSNGTTDTVSSDATVKSLTFVSNSNYPTLSSTVFTVEDRIDTGLIYNVDSILYNTPIDSIVPSFRFNATPGAAVIYTPNDTIALTGSDTIDFSVRPVLLHVIASDYVSDKWYEVQVNVHQIDPDLYAWERVQEAVYPAEGTEQKLLYHKGALKWVVNNGIQNKLFVSSDEGKHWEERSVVGLPQNCRVRNILGTADRLFYCQDNLLYISTDGQMWVANDHSAGAFQFVNMLCKFNDSIWAIVQQKSDMAYYFAASSDGDSWIQKGAMPDDFPISDYAVENFSSVTGRERLMVVGGYTAKGEMLNTRWNVECTPSGEYRCVNFSIEQPSFGSLAGISIIWYNNRFFMFGGTNVDNELNEYTLLESVDEGMHWSVPDTAHNYLPASYHARTKQSVVVSDNYKIFVAGGQSRTEIFSDIYVGHLNSIDW